tara:strand:- start:2882 stop:3997 length:1116 start_codon:yes stop_codon:yes gene_type:complete
MKILIYTGYQTPWLSKKLWLDKGIGGTEYCYIKLAEALNKLGHTVVVSGHVDEAVEDGVHYIPLDQLKKHQSPLGLHNANTLRGYDHYDVVIAGQYAHYQKELARKKITYSKSIFWIHNDEGWYNWYRGNVMKNDEVKQAILTTDRVVCVSKLHVDIIKAKFKALDYTPPNIHTYIHSIDNAIDLDDWSNIEASKIKGRIIWSSSPDRGLKTILDNWADMKLERPELTLTIACPPYASDWDTGLIEQDGIEYLGALSPKRLKEEQLKAEYWIYQSEYLETYCITGVEMMLSNTKLLTNGTGNIKNIVGNGDRGMIIDNNPATIKETLMRDVNDRSFAREWSNKTIVAREWAIKQTWDNRVNEWITLINNIG